MPDSDQSDYPERRHRQPGRRAGDANAYSAGAVVEAFTDDRLFPAWKKEDVIKWLTILSLAGGIAVAVITFVSSRFATRKEIEEQVRPVVDTLNSLKSVTDQRIRRLEARQDTLYTVRQIIPAMARLQCLELAQWKSGSLAQAAGLPCDSLLSHSR